jgi:sugar phosphate isomerase/epimerase
MKPLVALSTCWNSHRHQDGHAMLCEIAGLGFKWVELSHGIRIPLVPGLLKALAEGVIKVSSCHNFCPLPTGVAHAAPNLYMPSSPDARERDQWLRHTKRSLDFAHQVGAAKLVLHLGCVEFFWFNPARKLDRYLDAHPDIKAHEDAAYRKVLATALGKVKTRMPEFWANTRAGIGELLPHARQKNVLLGFENREKLEELPLDADHGELLQSLSDPVAAGYWHDAGHADLKEKLGLIDHRQHLAALAPRTIGFHLHDVSKDGRDHQAIGSGRVDFEMVSEFWRPEHSLVIELSPRLSVEEVILSKRRIDELVARRFGG